jgi:4-hydroxy-tetrahydrodipicolinate synthase
MEKSIFTGTGVALVTPFRRDDSLDLKALSNIVEHIINNKVNYLVVLGTTGETPVLSDAEKTTVVRQVIEAASGRVPLVLGMGGNNTSELINKIKSADLKGIDALLTVTPHYNKPSQKGLYEHYMAVAAASPLPIIIYNVPSRTGCNISAETTLQLAAENKKFAGIKEASGDMNQIMKIAASRPDHFDLISGDDLMTLPMLALGGSGVISVLGNAFPRKLSEMVRMALANRWEEARAIHNSLLEIIENLFIEGNPSGVKAALHILNICENHVRLPLSTVSRHTYGKISDLIKSIPI